MQPIQILLAGGQKIFLAGLKKLLEREPDLKVVAETAEAQETTRLVEQFKPDIVVLELSFPFTQANGTLQRLYSCRNTRTLLVASGCDKPLVVEAVLLGARGLVWKDAAAAVLIRGIREINKGRRWIKDHATADLASALKELAEPVQTRSSAGKYRLTPREIEIAMAIASARSNRQIAKTFSISEETVKHHVTHLFDKLGVYNRLELALFAIRHDLLDQAGRPR